MVVKQLKAAQVLHAKRLRTSAPRHAPSAWRGT
jgi:hypothetical protein